MFVITYEDRKIVENEISRDIELNPQYGIAAFKFIYNLLNQIHHSDLLAQHFNPYINLNTLDSLTPKQLSDAFNQLLQLAFESSTEIEKPLLYTTGQIATYFGVSTTTINNWLRDKRILFPSMDDKQSFKQARIPITAIYRSTNGKETVIREVIQEYEYQKSQEPVYDEVERMKNLVQLLLTFESKYNGKYEEVVSRIGDPNSSDDWKWTRDADEWRYVMKEITGDR
ncbi:hypothetical protein [Cohnella abietis]|uniref:Helix-turn-helix domain-containing protein n=1 Tax=Cohnella abietis TaxID=2507935 RepID=A0A3T1CZN8_9BACL|nr:hypothetical protein [Cohnella abietis]BBI31313.1 hypothetical protein KCTCHS21_07120 [Cohnella abietis]